MNFYDDPEIKSLISRLDDLEAKAAKGDMGVTQFLTPKEIRVSEEYLRRRGVSHVVFGGYENAERRRVYLLPDYMEEGFCAEDTTDLENKLSEYGYDTDIRLLTVVGSGYKHLTHRDFLGSVLGLGVDRGVVGDIILLDDEGRAAAIFCDRAIAEFFMSELTFVSNDKVKVASADLRAISLPEKKTAPIHDTVAAPRLDAVVAALCNMSRDKARGAVISGLVELNFECEERPDKVVAVPATLSVRGVGRFKVLSLSDKTRKGRYRLEAEKYI